VRLKTVAIIGTNGIPAKYGGFETLAENIVRQLNSCYNFIVYCSNKNNDSLWASENGNVKLIRVPLDANGAQAVLYDIITTIHAWFKADTLLVLGPAAGFFLFLNALFRKNVIVNHGGLNEWDREKYSVFQRFIIRQNHKVAARFSTHNVADNYVLNKSIEKVFGVNSIVIKYGGDHIRREPVDQETMSQYQFLAKNYDLSISRAQVDNNLHMVLKAYSNVPQRNIVLISNWEISRYGQSLKNQYCGKFANIYLLDAIYDSNILNIIRNNTSLYLHSHSRCGTAPSLVEAMNYNIPVLCFDNETNRETTENESIYFSSVKELEDILRNICEDDLVANSNKMFKIAKNKYNWKLISQEYSQLFKQNITSRMIRC